jgi:glycyl-tRNA synthetase beta chain
VSELFVEIGAEELPARAVVPAAEALAAGLVRLLGPIAHGAIRTFGTPRRIAVAIHDVAPARPAVEKIVTGPPVAQAFPGGVPGPVAEAFARARGVSVAQLLEVDGPKGKVIGVLRVEGGESTADVVAKGLEDVVLGIPFKRSMRWTETSARFVRPIHRVCAIFDGQVIESSVAGVLTGGHSKGHWLWAPEAFPVSSAAGWLTDLRERFVIADVAERRELILAQLVVLAEDRDADVNFDPDLLDEVVQLVEWPRTIVGRFAPNLLELPPRLLVESMKKNQRYFPLYREGELTNEFLVVTNNPHGDDAIIAEGNGRVLAARFHDARFFYAEDRKKSLHAHGEKLAGMLWIRGLGTMAEREESLANAVVGLAALAGADPAVARRAALLCKADLTTQMVGEFPELQGHVGQLLAGIDGEPLGVARAIEEHYLPRFTGDRLPATPAGRALALAERITLLGRAFSAGLAPKGSADQLGLRRAANGIVAIVLAADLHAPLGELFAACGETLTAELRDFVIARLRATLQDEAPVDIVDAVLATGSTDLASVAARVKALADLVRNGTFGPIRVTFRRVAGLVKGVSYQGFDADVLTQPTERALLRVLQETGAGVDDVAEQIAMLERFRPLVDAFFDAVLVMCDDEVLRRNRLALLTAIRARFDTLADFTRLSGE